MSDLTRKIYSRDGKICKVSKFILINFKERIAKDPYFNGL